MAKGIKKTFKDFIREAHEVHGKSTYDYSDFIFKNYSTEGLIKCKVEGHKAFKKTPNYHINKKKGCPKCSHEQRYADTFKAKCKRLRIDYWRALKRREAGSNVGVVKRVNTGVFQITVPNSTRVSSWGSYDTSTINKDITAVMGVTFGVKK